jgi:hypothetical protein
MNKCVTWVLFLLITLSLTALSLTGCEDSTSSPLLSAPPSNGPLIAFELDLNDDESPAQSPLPNDLFTSISLESTAGQPQPRATRLPSDWHPNASAWSTLVDQMHGAPTSPLIYVPLSAPIDADLLRERHANSTLEDDLIFLLCLSPKCLGKPIALDIERPPLTYGIFANLQSIDQEGHIFRDWMSRLSLPVPQALKTDPRLKGLASLLWSDETQRVGAISQQPLENEGAALFLRPLMPLSPQTQYAVIITTDLTDEAGSSVRSPFEGSHHPQQRETLQPVIDFLPQFGLNQSGVALMWSFTTGDPTQLISTVSDAIRGQGPLVERTAALRPSLITAHHWVDELSQSECDSQVSDRCDVSAGEITLTREGVAQLAVAWAQAESDEGGGRSEEELERLVNSYETVDHLFGGTLSGWEVAHIGAPSKLNREETPWTGIDFRSVKRSFWCVIPREGVWFNELLEPQSRQAPFPVVLWASDSVSERLELLKWAGQWSQFGLASCAIESTPKYEPLPSALGLTLSRAWSGTPWSISLALSWLNRGSPQDSISSTDEEVPQSLSKAARFSDLVPLREINRTLALQQLSHWLSDEEIATDLASTSASDRRALLESARALIDVRNLELPLSYGGEGGGAAAAILSGAVDPYAGAVVAVDPTADYVRHSAIAQGQRGLTETLRDTLGPWLKCQLNAEAEVSMDSVSYECSWEHDPSITFSFSAPETASWATLDNVTSAQLGRRRPLRETTYLTVGGMRGDQVTLSVFSNPSTLTPLEMEVTPALQTDILQLPRSGWGASPQSVEAREAWMWSSWLWSLVDPINFIPSLYEAPKAARKTLEQGVEEANLFILTHPHRETHPVASGLSLARVAHLSSSPEWVKRVQEEGSDSISDKGGSLWHPTIGRPDLYDLTEDDLFLYIGVYDSLFTRRDPSWVDWDTLDEGHPLSPPLERSMRLRLESRSPLGRLNLMRAHLSSASFHGSFERLDSLPVSQVGAFLSRAEERGGLSSLDDECLKVSFGLLGVCRALSRF